MFASICQFFYFLLIKTEHPYKVLSPGWFTVDWWAVFVSIMPDNKKLVVGGLIVSQLEYIPGVGPSLIQTYVFLKIEEISIYLGPTHSGT